MNKLRIGLRLTLTFGLLSLFILIVASIGAFQINALRNLNHHAATVDMKLSLTASHWADAIVKNWIRTEAYLHSNDANYLTTLQNEIKQTSESISEDQKFLKSSITDEAGIRLLEQSDLARAKYRDLRTTLLEKKANKESISDALDSELRPLAVSYIFAVNKVAKYQADSIDALQASIESKSKSAQLFIGLCCALAIVIAIFFAVYITRSITKPLADAQDFTGKIAKGDLTGSLELNAQDEVGSLLRSLSAMNESLKSIVRNVRDGAESISTSAKALSEGNTDLSQRTEEQAASLEETAATMEEITATVKQTADNAITAKGLAVTSSDVAALGGKLTAQVIQTMDGITQSSKKAADIISVIDGIAFQTNILALNAAVEAARAGEHGRGFAVVASEVRNLAQRSANAAKEIKTLVSESIQRTEEGSKLVAQAGKTMNEIVSSSKMVVDIMSEISTSAQEQSNGISQISIAINQIDQVTQQNASLVEEAAASSEEMEGRALTLLQAVSAFRVSSDDLEIVSPFVGVQETAFDPGESIDVHTPESMIEEPLESHLAPGGESKDHGDEDISLAIKTPNLKRNFIPDDSNDDWKRF